MNPEIKERWVARLESGKDAQTTGYLANNNGFCCLGVLCEIAVEDGIVIKRTVDEADGEQNYISKVDEEDASGSELPNAVSVWAGLTTDDKYNPRVQIPYGLDGELSYFHLSELNDDLSMTFPEIAKIIKEHL
jgi:hypothetical protein